MVVGACTFGLSGVLLSSTIRAQQVVAPVADTTSVEAGTGVDSVSAALTALRSPPPNVVPTGNPRPEDDPMAGIAIDSTEQTRIDSVNAVYVPQLQSSAKTLSAASPSTLPGLLSDAKALYSKYVAAIRGALSSANQIIFDQNQATLKAKSLTLQANLAAWENGQ